MINLLDHGYIKLIETWGSDERIIESARMSTDGGFNGWGPKHPVSCLASSYGASENDCTCGSPTAGDEKLLRYLWEHKHSTPFEMAGMTLEIQAPIFVIREWHRHRTQGYSEQSARYVALPDLTYLPSTQRIMAGKQATKNKQSSEAGFTEKEADLFRGEISAAYTEARNIYEDLLAAGVAREVARVVLPVGQYSRMRATANLRNWLGFLALRQAKDAQWEIRQYADAVAEIADAHFPRTLGLFKEGQCQKINGTSALSV